MNRKPNFLNVLLSVPVGLTLILSAAQPVGTVSAMTTPSHIVSMPSGAPNPADIDRFVIEGGSDAGDNTCSVSSNPCATIQQAVNKAQPGDIVGVAAGVYKESVLYEWGYLRTDYLSGGWDASFTSQIGYSTIDGENIRTGLEVGASRTVFIDHFIIQNGHNSMSGGGIINYGNLTISQSIIQNNISDEYGGGVYKSGDGILSIKYSTVANNTAKFGGGGVAGSVAVSYTTFARNTANMGGAIFHSGNSNTTLNNATFIENRAGNEGGTFYNSDPGSSVKIKNSILVSSSANACAFYSNSRAYISLGYNLFNRKCEIELAPTDFNVSDPLIGKFIPSLGYVPLPAISPAVNNGGNCVGETDQRGQAWVGACDIGAFEYVTPGAVSSLSKISGDGQTANPNKDFPRPLVAVALDGGGNPVPGTQVTFDSPTSGATATFMGTGTHSQTVTTDVYGQATTSQLTANSEYGPFDIQVSSANTPLLTFSLENLMWTVSPTGSDLNTCKTPLDPCQTIQAAISKAHIGGTIFVAEGVYAAASGDQVVLMDKAIDLSGGCNSDFSSCSGYSTIDGNNARRGVTVGFWSSALTVSIDRFVITNGKNSNGGGIYIVIGNNLTLLNSIVSDNHAVNGGGIFTEARTNLTIKNSMIKNNHATVSPTAGEGGGIQFKGMLEISHSSIFGNEAQKDGGGINSSGYETGGSVANSTIVNNHAGQFGGAIHRTVNSPSSLTLNNVTITENSAEKGGGLSGSVYFQNSIIANNHAEEERLGNCDGLDQISLGYNIIYPYCPFASVQGSVYLMVDPKLGAFLPDEGYVPLMQGSPAIERGNPAVPGSGGSACLADDQRGVARPQGLFCDMGAFELELYPATPLRVTSTGMYDGWALEYKETSDQGGTVDSSGTLQVGDDALNKQYRSLLYFDTSALPDNAVIVKVTLKIKKREVKGTDPFTTHGNLLVDLRKGTFGKADLEKTDFQAAATKSGVGKLKAITGVPKWYQMILGALNVKYINLKGVTQFRLRFTRDDNNDNGADFIQFYSGDNSVPLTSRPVLIIEYMVP